MALQGTPISFVGINQTETASIAFNQIDRNKVLSTVRRRKPGCRFFAVIVAFRRHLLSGLIKETNGNFRWVRGCSRKPILVSRVEIYRHQSVLMRLDDSAPVSISNLEAIV